MAQGLARALRKASPDTPVHLRATKRAGHGEKLAYQCAKASKRPLVVSSSGDGGYNEVINGLLKAQSEGAQPVAAVLPAGNANDHSRTMHDDQPLHELILAQEERAIDVLKVEFQQNREHKTRYAHSYVGLGLTPLVAVELNKTDLNRLNELFIAIRTFMKFRPLRIRARGKKLVLDSILFTNIGQMAKTLTVAKNAKPYDGKFEVVTFPHEHKWALLKRLAKAQLLGLHQTRHYQSYMFELMKRAPAQLDGEVEFIDKGSIVTISVAHKALRTIAPKKS